MRWWCGCRGSGSCGIRWWGSRGRLSCVLGLQFDGAHEPFVYEKADARAGFQSKLSRALSAIVADLIERERILSVGLGLHGERKAGSINHKDGTVDGLLFAVHIIPRTLMDVCSIRLFRRPHFPQ